ncbi:MAG: hypothetical protein LBU32_17455 [Clostridiales bacterium]|jgi:multiple sugar transport system substrate-binding protein|nr:hypothetical protein [Clostridiales bacterium]
MKKKTQIVSFLLAAALTFSLAACGSGGNTGDSKLTQTFQTWDRGQTPRMEAMAAAYTAKNHSYSDGLQSDFHFE